MNKEVCRGCQGWRWDDEVEKGWDQGNVMCPSESDINMGMVYFSETTPPSFRGETPAPWCIYELEHLVLEQGEVNE